MPTQRATSPVQSRDRVRDNETVGRRTLSLPTDTFIERFLRHAAYILHDGETFRPLVAVNALSIAKTSQTRQTPSIENESDGSLSDAALFSADKIALETTRC